MTTFRKQKNQQQMNLLRIFPTCGVWTSLVRIALSIVLHGNSYTHTPTHPISSSASSILSIWRIKKNISEKKKMGGGKSSCRAAAASEGGPRTTWNSIVPDSLLLDWIYDDDTYVCACVSVWILKKGGKVINASHLTSKAIHNNNKKWNNLTTVRRRFSFFFAWARKEDVTDFSLQTAAGRTLYSSLIFIQ